MICSSRTLKRSSKHLLVYSFALFLSVMNLLMSTKLVHGIQVLLLHTLFDLRLMTDSNTKWQRMCRLVNVCFMAVSYVV